LADCFYAPVIGRLRTYAVPLDAETQAYADAVWAQPDVRAWVEAAKAEPMKEPQYDV
jgi:glutathione S-transferase